MVGEAVQIAERRRIDAAHRSRGPRDPPRPPRHGTRRVQRPRSPPAARQGEEKERRQILAHLAHRSLQTPRLWGGGARRGPFPTSVHPWLGQEQPANKK